MCYLNGNAQIYNKTNALIFEFVYIIKYDTHLLKPKKWFSGKYPKS